MSRSEEQRKQEYSALSALLSSAERPTSPREAVIDALGVAVLTRTLFPRGAIDGLEANEMQVLLALFVDPDQTVTELTGRLGLAKTTVSHAVTHLQRAALVQELKDPSDRRRRPQRLTAMGKGVANDIALLLRRRLQNT